MGNEVGEVDPSFLQEVWGLYGLGMTILLLRFAVRIRTVGIRGFQGDDFFALLVIAFYTMDAATVHIIYYAGTNVEASVLETIRPLTPFEITQYEYGSKEQLAAWYSYTALLWCLKGTMLCFFQRMTMGSSHQMYVKWLGICCIASYVAVFLTITFGCWPFYRNWQVSPTPGLVCTFKMQNFIVTVVLNVLTDAGILAIPLPLLWKLQVPLKKKLVIGVLLSSGLFVIIAAIIRVVLTLGANASALNINRWGVRETIVGIIAVNVPILRSLFNKSFWRPGAVIEPSSKLKSLGTAGGNSSAPHGRYEMTSSSVHVNQRPGSFDGSEEIIIDKREAGHDNKVVVKTMFQVTSEQATEDDVADQWAKGSQSQGTASSAKAYRGSNAV